MTHITQANMDAAQMRLERAISDLAFVGWISGAVADELCGQPGMDPETMRILRGRQAFASQAHGAALHCMSETYALNLPGPVAPSFGNK